jgi:hypothetical protein
LLTGITTAEKDTMILWQTTTLSAMEKIKEAPLRMPLYIKECR